MAAIGLDDFGAALAALSALSTASFGLLDTTKAFEGGVSNIGGGHIRRELQPFAPALREAVGDDWWKVVRASWIGGVAKVEQKAKAQALVKLGLTARTAAAVAEAAHVDAETLNIAIDKLERGLELSDADLNVIGRLNAVIAARLDAAFERADQAYRNWCRFWAGTIALALAILAWAMWPAGFGQKPSLAAAFVVGLLAVPLSPVAKDLTSALSAAMQALKASRKF